MQIPKDKAYYGSWPPCIALRSLTLQVSFRQRATHYRARLCEMTSWPPCIALRSQFTTYSRMSNDCIPWRYRDHTVTIPWLYTMNKAPIVCPICIGHSAPNKWLFGGKRSATWGIRMSGSWTERDLLFGGKRPNEWLFSIQIWEWSSDTPNAISCIYKYIYMYIYIYTYMLAVCVCVHTHIHTLLTYRAILRTSDEQSCLCHDYSFCVLSVYIRINVHFHILPV